MDGWIGGRPQSGTKRIAIAGGNESEGGSRLSARALSISSALHAGLVITRRSSRRTSLAQLTSISRLFLLSCRHHRRHVFLSTALSFFVASREPRWTRSHPAHWLRDCADLLSTSGELRIVCLQVRCGNYGGYVEPTAAQIRDPKVSVHAFHPFNTKMYLQICH